MRRIADITIANTYDIDRADEHISIANITAQVGVSFGSVKRNISKVCALWIPKCLTSEKKL